MQTPPDEEERKAFFGAVVTAVFRAAHEHRGASQTKGQGVVDASGMVDALAFTQALILEFHPRLQTDADIRAAVERVGNELFRLIKVMRKSTQDTGTHPISDFGVGNPMAGGAN